MNEAVKVQFLKPTVTRHTALCGSGPIRPVVHRLLLKCLFFCLLPTLVTGNEASRQIDSLLSQHWQKQGISPNPPVDDATFVRRIHLDVIGRIPTLEETEAFLADPSPERRSALIDRLLASEGHAQHLFHFWADLLRIQSRANGGQGEMTSKPYLEHVKRRIRENMPYDAFVRELLIAQGKVWDNPAIGYYMRDLGMPLDNLANTTRVFLGTRIECAQCHNDPFDKWTQKEFYQMAAFTYPLETNFTGVSEQGELLNLKRKAEKQPDLAQSARHLGTVFENLGDFVRYSKVQALPKRVLKLPHDYAYSDTKPHDTVAAATMIGAPAHSRSLEDFASWLTAPENPRFTLVIANRLWKKVFGRGLIEPVDELMDHTVAVHPDLMVHLERQMVAGGYDLRAFLRLLYNTQAYQRHATHAEVERGEPYHFPGPLLRRMSAEQIYDSFVTLIHPNPDLPRRQGLDAEMAQKLAYRGKLSDALDLLTPQEIFTGALKAAETYESLSQKATPLREAYTAAQLAKDKPLMEKLNLEIRSISFVARTGIHEHVVVPAVARLYERKTGQPAPPPIPVKRPTMEELRKPGYNRAYIDVPGYDFAHSIDQQEATAERMREALFLNEARHHDIQDVPAYLKARQAQTREWPRAADLESPAPRGHFLREFGQSDRDLIENASTDASIPQALLLMNSELFTAILKPHTQLRTVIDTARDSEEQLQNVYRVLLSRPPTQRERSAWASSGLSSIDDLIHALINTQEFIHIR